MAKIKTPTNTVTGPQLRSGPSVYISQAYSAPEGLGELPRDSYGTLTPKKIREMRKDPTIAMVRQLALAPALLAPWTYEETRNAPVGAVKFIEEQLEPLRTYIVRQAMLGCIDFGWAPFEKIFAKVNLAGGKIGGKIGLCKMKPLLQDWTDIVVSAETGAYMGLVQEHESAEIFLPGSQTFVHCYDPEGTYWYGQGCMPNAEMPYDNWHRLGQSSDRYDAKIAGSQWVVHYPIGTSLFNGAQVDNEVIATDVLGSLRSSGGIAVPKSAENFVADLNGQTPNAWEIELLSDAGSTSASFTDRQSYYDKLKVRAFGFPERSILEGQFGTKAEAEAHADFAIATVLLRLNDLIRDVNWYIVNQLLRLNYGLDKENTVVIASGALGDANKEFLQGLYIKLLDKPEGFTAEFDNIDRGVLRDSLEIPTDEEAEADELRDATRLRDGLRDSEPTKVGGPGQPAGSDDDRLKDNMGVGPGIREGEQQIEDGSLQSAVSKSSSENNSERRSEDSGVPFV